MNVFDRLFPRHTRRQGNVRRSGREAATSGGRNRLRGLGLPEQFERRDLLAVVTPFDVRYTFNDTGNITFAANTLMTAPDSDPAAAAARNGTGSKLNNNDFRMAYVDIDGDNTTFNSSSASLVLPAGADVLFAGLYWGARVNSSFPTGKLSEINNVKFRGPTDGTTYTPLAGTTIGTTTAGAPDSGVSTYQSFKDVTAIVQTEGAGVYTMANVQAIKDSADYCAGWALVVVYHSAADPLRNLTVFDGFGSVINSDTITFPISGFTAPPSGPVEAAIGFVSYEGDLGFTGDNAYIDGGAGFQQLSNTTNPADNFFNSTITNRNTYVTTKTPNYQNQLGFDADIFATTNVITNGATSATVKMSTNGDYYYPGVVTSCIDLYAPKITVQKAVADVNGGIVQPGDVLRYTITVANDANAYDTAANVILNDLIPAYTTYKPNTLFITAGANSSAAVKTDPVDFDQAEFLSGAVRFQLGTGAGGGGPPPVGGTLKKGEFTTVTFDVTVNSGFPSEALIKNTAVVSFTSQFTGQPFTATASAEIKCPPVADLAIVKTDPSGTYVPGQDLTYTLTVTNNGPAAVTGAVVSDELPVGTTLVDAHGGSYNPVTRTVTYTTGSLAAGGVQAFLLTVLPASSLTGDLTNTATVVAPAGTYDPDKTNNTSTDKTTCKPQANLAIKKTANPTTVTAGGSGYTYQITVTNTGPSDAQTVSVVDTLPAGFTATAYDQAGVSPVAPTAGPFTWTIGTLAAGASKVLNVTYSVGAGVTAGVKVNSATVTSSTDGPHTATANVTVVIDAGLTILKTASPTSVTAGVGGYSYQITVTNTGKSDAQTVSVVDTLPVGFTATAYDQAGVSPVAPTAGPFTWTIGTLAAGASKVLNVTYSVGAGVTAGVKTNSATVTSSTDDPHTATADVTVATAAKLEITKTPDIQLVTAGDGIVYTYLITVTNTGSSDAHNVSVVDTWPGPAGSLVQGAFAPSQGSITNQDAAGNFTWLVGTLPSGTATLTVNYTVPATTPTQAFTNTVVASSDETDPNNKPTASAVTEVSNPIIPTAGEGVAVLGTDDGCPVPPVVRVVDKFGTIVTFFDSTNGLYEPGFKGSVRVTSGDITGDGIADIVVAPGRGHVGQIRAFIASGTGAATIYTYDSRYDTLPFGSTWRSGVEVAVGDVNGDGIGDIIAGQSRGAGLVRAFLVGDPSLPDPVANSPYRSFRGYPPTYAGGVMVASADLTGDGKAEIIVGNNAGMRSKVKVFDVTGTPTVIRTILPFASNYRGGVTLSVGRYDGDSVDDIFIGAGVRGQSTVEIYSGASGAQLARLTAFSSFTKTNARTFTAGVDLTGSGTVDTLYGVKGLNGGGGAKGVRQYNVATQVTSPLTSDPALSPPLRIAPIPRPVLQTLRRR